MNGKIVGETKKRTKTLASIFTIVQCILYINH